MDTIKSNKDFVVIIPVWVLTLTITFMLGQLVLFVRWVLKMDQRMTNVEKDSHSMKNQVNITDKIARESRDLMLTISERVLHILGDIKEIKDNMRDAKRN